MDERLNKGSHQPKKKGKWTRLRTEYGAETSMVWSEFSGKRKRGYLCGLQRSWKAFWRDKSG